MSSGELALALVNSLQRAPAFTDANGGDDADAQPARTPNSRNGTLRIMARLVAKSRGSIVCIQELLRDASNHQSSRMPGFPHMSDRLTTVRQ
jgi:hypothetical protein